MRLRTQLRAIPLLLCCFSGSALAAGLPPLVVSPDLMGGGSARTPAKPAPAAAPVEPVPAGVHPAAKAPAPAPTVATPAGAVSGTKPAQAPSALPPGATEVRALRIRGTRSVELLAEGDAELQRDDLLLSADKLTYRELDDEAHAEGNVRLRRGEDQMSGPEARLKLEERLGSFEEPTYRIKRQSTQPVQPGETPREIAGGGSADVLYFEGENQYRLKNATWSTCEASDPDWYLKASDLHLDYDRELGTAKGATLVFQDVPMLWWPWAEFPLVGQRQSGFLAPTFGMSNKVGLDISVPYYWNIAPNYDATIAPRVMGRRGVQLATEFRYLTPTQAGEARVEYLPRDNVTGEERALGSFQHTQVITPSLFAAIDWNGVTDKEYFEDLSSRVSVASRANLVRKGTLSYAGSEWWNASALVQSYQTLSGGEPYRKLPQLLLNANRGELIGGSAFAFRGEYVQFDHPDSNVAEGSRFTLHPQVSLPFERAGYYVTPKLGLHYTQYDLDRDLSGNSRSITRSVPIFSVDSGLMFERDTSLLGRDFLQTLEPRVFYVKTPYRDQSDIPVFDSSRYDFGLAQIFSENQYSGGDRIADANQVTAAVTSRLIDPETGGERLRATVGQRFYFDDQRVTLPGEEPRTGRRADVLGLFSGYIMSKTWLDSNIQYNPRDNWTERFNAGVRYQPDFAKALNLSYRYSRGRLADESDKIQDLALSGQWPLGGGWYGVGRVTRSLTEDRITEAIAGIEYDGGCWVVRTAVHRFATDPNDVTQAVFVQLELNDLASVGTSPVNLLKRSVAGYGKINDPVSDRVFGAE
ncbi:LPS-assembly protein LptD [Aromatoleum evansii]|uniref:LPS-assembly protein LptD n=1 Tax=Aromatoleum evansii TaxID=59406 RepID=A0ABZ1ARY6_AROEV|nr:LPS-assembly protein LptD [Aromatoleum evansii]